MGRWFPVAGRDSHALAAHETLLPPQFTRSDNCVEFTAKAVMRWLRDRTSLLPALHPAADGKTARWRASTASYAMQARIENGSVTYVKHAW